MTCNLCGHADAECRCGFSGPPEPVLDMRAYVADTNEAQAAVGYVCVLILERPDGDRMECGLTAEGVSTLRHLLGQAKDRHT